MPKHAIIIRLIFSFSLMAMVAIGCGGSDGSGSNGDDVETLKDKGLVGLWDFSDFNSDISEFYIEFKSDNSFVLEASSYFDRSGNPVYSSIFIYGTYTTTIDSVTFFPDYAADERVELTGDNGYIWINQCTANTIRNEAPIISFLNGELTEYFDIETDWQISFTNAVNHFIEAIINDTTPEVTPEEGRKIQQFAQAAHTSCKTHREEHPDEMT